MCLKFDVIVSFSAIDFIAGDIHPESMDSI